MVWYSSRMRRIFRFDCSISWPRLNVFIYVFCNFVQPCLWPMSMSRPLDISAQSGGCEGGGELPQKMDGLALFWTTAIKGKFLEQNFGQQIRVLRAHLKRVRKCALCCFTRVIVARRETGEVSWLRRWQIRDGSSEESPKQVELSALHHGEKSVCTYTNNSLGTWNWERG